MKTSMLLPFGFQKIGWMIFIPTFALGCDLLFFNGTFSLPFRDTVLNNIAIVGTVLGALMIGFSRERFEDEMIQKIRLDALLAAVWINYLLLIVFSLAVYDLAFLNVMAANMATTLVIFIVLFRIRLWRLKKNMAHEK